MLAISIDAGQVQLVELPRPQVEQATDAIVMVTTTAIGHWEIEAVRASGSAAAPGAQFAGIVVEAGQSVSKVNIDDLVIATCAVDLQGHLTRFGSESLPGGHAEYVRVPNADETLTKTTAAAEERSVFAGGEAALGIRAANGAIEAVGDRPIVIFGCDTSALVAIAWIRHRTGRNAQMFAVESNPARLAAARSLGAQELEFDDFQSVGPAAVIAGMTVSSTPPDVPVFPTGAGGRRDGFRWPTLEETYRAEMAIRLRQIDLTPLVSTVLPLDEAADAYRVAAEQPPGIRGVLLKP